MWARTFFGGGGLFVFDALKTMKCNEYVSKFKIRISRLSYLVVFWGNFFSIQSIFFFLFAFVISFSVHFNQRSHFNQTSIKTIQLIGHNHAMLFRKIKAYVINSA